MGDGGPDEGVDGRWRRKRWAVARPRGFYERRGREIDRAEEGGILGAPLAANGTTGVQ